MQLGEEERGSSHGRIQGNDIKFIPNINILRGENNYLDNTNLTVP